MLHWKQHTGLTLKTVFNVNQSIIQSVDQSIKKLIDKASKQPIK